ncbi:HNH endonuclease [Bosea sp. AS-1]|uniref:HNH endonuclease n=1 Tax=Bosea sp. AS-1 TaxID=2015316 RepID=UPI000B774C4E|nr:HNH endonuclease [Bosea sp. AS-1]
MTKLTTLGPTLNRLPHTLTANASQERTRSAQRYATQAWRKWYGLKRWKDMRAEVLLDALYSCQRCGRIEGDTSLLVADHIKPHRGRAALFWDRNNIQCLCKECHDTVKQREEKAEPVGVWD